MYILEKNVTKEYVIQKSKFICVLIKVYNVDEIDNFLKQIKIQYKKATHYCYAYRLNNLEKCSDDKEPQGTAGVPILNILKKKQINNILCVVVRYFGGIKLGVGGLIRAYQNSVLNCLNNVNLIEDKKIERFKIEFEYDKIKEIEYILKNEKIIKKIL